MFLDQLRSKSGEHRDWTRDSLHTCWGQKLTVEHFVDLVQTDVSWGVVLEIYDSEKNIKTLPDQSLTFCCSVHLIVQTTIILYLYG